MSFYDRNKFFYNKGINIVLKNKFDHEEIKNIILGGGQNLLSPERRFDAIIFNYMRCVDLFAGCGGMSLDFLGGIPRQQQRA